MKKLLFSTLIVAFSAILFTGCEKEETAPAAPELPPIESMSIDFGNLNDDTKSASAEIESLTKFNHFNASVTALYWNVIVGVTLAVPIASFHEAIKHEAVYLGDSKWQWEYEVSVVGAKYKARMTGKLSTANVKWEMYVSKDGIGSFPEFKWFEGTSAIDGKSGQWIMYHSPTVQEAMMQIDWKVTGDKVGDIKYTYVRESNDGVTKQLSKDSYLEYGLKDADLDAFYNVHYTTRDIEDDGFLDVNIEWNTTAYNGRIKAEHYYQDTEWHCWDGDGYDVDCP